MRSNSVPQKERSFRKFIRENPVSASEVGATWALGEMVLLRGALSDLLACSPCQNACEPDDLNCATNRARVALRRKLR